MACVAVSRLAVWYLSSVSFPTPIDGATGSREEVEAAATEAQEEEEEEEEEED